MPKTDYQRVIIDLTDTAIKALPGTPKLVVSAPPTGKMIWPVRALAICNFSGGAYEDSVGSGSVVGELGFSTDLSDAETEALNILNKVSAIDTLNQAVSGTVRFTIMGSGYDAGNSLNTPRELSAYDGKALSFGFVNRASPTPLVGGHPSNRIRLLLDYDVIDL